MNTTLFLEFVWQFRLLFLVGAMLLCFWLWNFRSAKQNSALIIQVSHREIEEFYKLAEDLLADPATPNAAHDMVYDMVELITNDAHGAKFYDFIKNYNFRADGPIHQELKQLSKYRLDLYEKFNAASAAWFFCILASHGRSDISVMVETSDRPKLIDTISDILSHSANRPGQTLANC
jgi:hypothetical protein